METFIIQIYKNVKFKVKARNKLQKAGLLEKEIKKIMGNKKLLKHYKWFLIPKTKIKDLRTQFKLNSFDQIRDHILYQDPSGRTIGCGCVICCTRNRERREKDFLKTTMQQQKKFNLIENHFEREFAKLKEIHGSDFNIEDYNKCYDPFQSEIFDRLGGSILRRKMKVLHEGDQEKGVRFNAFKRISNMKTFLTQGEDVIEYFNVGSPYELMHNIRDMLFKLDGKITNLGFNYLKFLNLRKNLQKQLLF